VDWLQGRLKMLFKNKDAKPDLRNWRGIVLLDSFQHRVRHHRRPAYVIAED